MDDKENGNHLELVVDNSESISYSPEEDSGTIKETPNEKEGVTMDFKDHVSLRQELRDDMRADRKEFKDEMKEQKEAFKEELTKFNQDGKEREERIESSVQQLIGEIQSQRTDYNSRLNTIDTNLSSALQSQREEYSAQIGTLDNKIDTVKKDIKNSARWTIGIIVSVIGVAATLLGIFL